MAEPILSPGSPGAPGWIIVEPLRATMFETPFDRSPLTLVQAEQVNLWEEHLHTAIEETMQAGWEPVLASETTYHTLLSTPAITQFAPVMSPAFRSRSGRRAPHGTRAFNQKLTDAYDKYVAAIDYLFTVGKDDYKDRVTDTKPKYREGERTPHGLTMSHWVNLHGAVTKAWWFLNGDVRLNAAMQPGDVIHGNFPSDPPFLAEGEKWLPARYWIYHTIQGGCFYLDNIDMTKVYQRLTTWLTDNLSDDYLDPPASYVRFLHVEGVTKLRVLIASVDTGLED